MSDSKVLHRVIRRLAGLAVWSFFTELHVIGEENVPRDGPIIVTATHHNMMLDPAVLSVGFPYGRIMHYWSKASLFANPIMRQILLSSGNIPVDRGGKDNRSLFKGTFDALSKGLAVALFPEGTSYTEPHIMQVKAGAAWAALEYTKWASEQPSLSSSKGVVIIPATLVYTNKSKYRSDVILEFGRPIAMDAYKEQFLSGQEGASRAAAKRLTLAIEAELLENTINAPDWDTLYAARMARDLMWESDRSINLDDFVVISQTLVDLFCTPDATPNIKSVKRHLLEYYSLLQITHLTNSVLSNLPLPRTLDPNHPSPLPSRLLTLSVLVRDSIAVLARLPFFLFPFIVHLPVYLMGRLGARLADDEEETRAQNKVVFGLLLLLMIYPAAFFFLWALFWYTSVGAVFAASMVWLLAVYHNKLVNDNYQHAKRVVAAWRVLIGVWAPKRWDLSSKALSQYTTPPTPKPNIWLDKFKANPPTVAHIEEPPVNDAWQHRPPSRRLVRHVLRARAEAARALASFFQQLEQAPEDKPVRASAHLAKRYGGWVDDTKPENGHEQTHDANDIYEPPTGWRNAHEVVTFLRKRGAKIANLEHGIQGDWAAVSSDPDMTPTGEESDADMVFVSSSTST